MTNAELADKLESCEAVQVIYADRKETIQPAEFKTLLAALRLAAQADASAIQPQEIRALAEQAKDASDKIVQAHRAIPSPERGQP